MWILGAILFHEEGEAAPDIHRLYMIFKWKQFFNTEYR